MGGWSETAHRIFDQTLDGAVLPESNCLGPERGQLLGLQPFDTFDNFEVHTEIHVGAQ